MATTFWQKWSLLSKPSNSLHTPDFPTQMLPFFAVENTSLNLQAVAHMANIVVHCTRRHSHPNKIELLCYSAPIVVTVTATNRDKTELTFSLTVTVNESRHIHLKGLKVYRNTYTAAARICGIIYRKAVVLAPLTSESIFKACRDPSGRLITTDWPPARIVGLACTLFMQTYNGTFASAIVTPRNVGSLIASFSHALNNMAPTNLHVEYKASKVVVVITCSNPPQKSVHSIPFPNNLEFIVGERNLFRWKNPVSKDTENLQLHTQQLWRLIVGIVS